MKRKFTCEKHKKDEHCMLDAHPDYDLDRCPMNVDSCNLFYGDSTPSKSAKNNEAKNYGTPNCAICKWAGADLLGSSLCRSQGRKLTAICYNSEQCKSLFEVKPETESRRVGE